MNISSVSSSTGFTGQSNASIDTAIARLEKQITQVVKQISDESNGKDDAKTKIQLVETYTIELTALQAQVSQLQMQEQQSSTSASNETEQPAQSATSAITPNPANPGWSRYLNTVV
jgi:hypothetical protein